MRVKISGDLAFHIASFDSDKDWETLIMTSPRKKKKALKKDLAEVILKVIAEKAEQILKTENLVNDETTTV